MANTRVRRRSEANLPTRLKPRKSPSQARSKALVDAVVEAGARVLVERGWDAMTMQQVAEVAGVSPGSLYQYFPDQASLVTEIIERQSTRELEFHQARMASLRADATLGEVLDGLVDALLGFQAQEGPLMRQTLAALQHLGRYARLAERAAGGAQLLRAVLEAYRASIDPQVDLDLATHVLSNAIHSLTHDGVLPRPPSLGDVALRRELQRLIRGYLGL